MQPTQLDQAKSEIEVMINLLESLKKRTKLTPMEWDLWNRLINVDLLLKGVRKENGL